MRWDDEDREETEQEFLQWLNGVLFLALVLTIGYFLYHVIRWVVTSWS